MVPAEVLTLAVVVVGPPASGDTTMSILAEMGLAGFGHGPHPGAGLLAIM